jgi:hypothetical protein
MLLMLLRFFSHTEETDAELEHLSRATLRLMTMVIRPLAEVLTKMPVDAARLPGMTAGPGFGYNRDVHLLPHKPSAWVFFGERLWQLARAATELRLHAGIPVEFQEAVAALQDLACQFAPSDGPRGVAASRRANRSAAGGIGMSISTMRKTERLAGLRLSYRVAAFRRRLSSHQAASPTHMQTAILLGV